MTEAGSSGQFKAVQELMHEMVAMWQRVKDLKALKKSVAHSQELLESVQQVAVAR